MTQGTIIPPAVDQDSIEYGHVYANYVKSVADTPADDDANPDIVHVNGQVTFDSTFPGASARGSIRLPAEPRAYGLIVTGDTFEIVNSQLVDHEGREGVRLIASVDDIPLSWQAVVTLQDSSGRTIYNKSYIIHHDLWDSSGELLHINLPDLIPTPSRLEPPEGAAVRAAERAIEEIEAITQTNQQVKLDVEGLKSEVVTLHSQTGQRLTAAEAARAAAVTAQGLAEAAQSASETARSQAQTARTGAQTARTGAESARDEAQGHASNAASSASAASGSASDADSSATTASNHAGDAASSATASAGSAAAAAGSATDAARSESAAAGSASDAEAARAAAVVARTGAEDARSGSEAARSGAENARDVAVTKADEASSSAGAALAAKDEAEAARATSVTKADEASSSAAAALTAKDEAEAARATSVTKADEASSSAAAAQALHDDVEAAVAQFDVDFAADMALFTGIRDDINLVANEVANDANRAEGAAQATEDALTVVRAHRWVPQGEWNSGVAYTAGDVVAHDGGSYYAQADIPSGQEPPGGDWLVLGQGGITDAAELTGVLTDAVDASDVTVHLEKYFPGLDSGPLADLLGNLVLSADASVEASRITGALTDQVDASAAMVELDMSEVGGPPDQQMLLAQWLHSIYLTALDVLSELGNKADVDHTHDGADITGALTDQVDASEAMVTYDPFGEGAVSEPIAQSVGGLYGGMLDMYGITDSLQGQMSSKADVGHTHTADELTGALTDQVDASEAMLTFEHPVNGNPVTSPAKHIIGQALGAVQVLFGPEFDSKSDVGHTHTISDVSGLQDALDGKADTAHTHTAAEVGAEPAAWTGTQAQYDALGTYDPNTTYYVEEE